LLCRIVLRPKAAGVTTGNAITEIRLLLFRSLLHLERNDNFFFSI